MRATTSIEEVLCALKEWGLLLLTDAALPSVAGLVAGERVRGSWWSHPRSHEIFRCAEALAEHSDVLMAKLSRKVTYVHRRLWAALMAVARAREAWQMKGLSPRARRLLARVEAAGRCQGAGPAGRELEERLLVFGANVHTPSGMHVRILESWSQWGRARSLGRLSLTPDGGRQVLEAALASLNAAFAARARLPWVR